VIFDQFPVPIEFWGVVLIGLVLGLILGLIIYALDSFFDEVMTGE